MTVSSSTNKVSYSANGSLTTFAYTFKIFDQSDVVVILRAADGTETVQTITTHYTVTGVGSASGGNVVFGSAPASGVTVVILRSQPLTQGLDLVANDPFPAESLEEALDKLVFMSQKHEEELSRAIKGSRTNVIANSEFTVSATDRANKVFSFDASGNLNIAQELGTFKGNWATSTTYVARDIVKDTSTNNIFIVNSDHTSSGSQPLTTNSNSAKYDLIVDAASATTSATAAAASSATATTKASEAATSATASETAKTASETAKTASETAKTASETAQAASEAALDSFDDRYLGAKSTSGGNPTVDNDGDALIDGALFFDTTNNVLMVYNLGTTTWLRTTPTSSDQTAINAVNADASDIGTVAGISSNVTTVAGISANVTTVAGQTTNLQNVTDNLSAIQNAGTNATNAASSATAAASSQTAAAASQVAAAASAASAATSYDSFDDRYLGVKSSDPTVDNDGDALASGMLYFSSSENIMKVYDGASWIAATSAGNVSLTTYQYSASGGQTTFSGSDANSATLSYTVNNILVTLNGSLLFNGTDYTATNGTSVVLASGATASDVLQVTSFKSFTTADMVPASTGGTFSGNVNVTGSVTSDGLTVDGAATITVTDNSDALTLISTDADANVGPVLNLYRNSASPADNDVLGRVLFKGEDDAGNEATFARIQVTATDVSNGSEDARIDFIAAKDDTFNAALSVVGDKIGIGTIVPSMILDVDGSSGGNDVARFSGPNSGGLTFRNATSNEFIMHTATSDALIFGTGGNNERMRIDSSGKLLVGSTSSTFNGDAKIVLIPNSDSYFINNGQTLSLNRTSTDGAILGFYKDQSGIGSIDVDNGDNLTIQGNSSHSGLQFGTNAIFPHKNGANISNTIDLGESGLAFKSLYLSGTIGANSSTAFSSMDGRLMFDNDYSSSALGPNKVVVQAEGNWVGGLGVSNNFLDIYTGGGIRFNKSASQTSYSTPMTLDASGNLLVGTTSTSLATTSSETGAMVTDGSFQAAANNPVAQFNRITTDGAIVNFRKDGSTVGFIAVNGNDFIISGPSAVSGIAFNSNGLLPALGGTVSDNTEDIGQADLRYDDIHATNGTIQTSDRNEKQDIAELTDAEQRVAVAAKGLLRKFRWKDKVAEKGDKARTHFGIIAQDLQAAFEAEGLDAGDYAMFISSTWTDEETGEERTRMGVRYSELLAFIIAAI